MCMVMGKKTIDWDEVLRLWREGYSCLAVARQCGCTRQAVHKWAKTGGLLVRTPQGVRRVLKPVKPR